MNNNKIEELKERLEELHRIQEARLACNADDLDIREEIAEVEEEIKELEDDINEENNNGNDTNVGSIGNSIEDIARIAKLITTKFNNDYSIDNKDKEAIEHILSDYKRVLKENEKLKNKLLDTLEGQKVIKEETPQYIKENFIPVQKIKDKIEKLNDESHAEELEDIMIGKNYTITELVQYVLQELIEESEEK